jgi:hypothetical protein
MNFAGDSRWKQSAFALRMRYGGRARERLVPHIQVRIPCGPSKVARSLLSSGVMLLSGRSFNR